MPASILTFEIQFMRFMHVAEMVWYDFISKYYKVQSCTLHNIITIFINY